MVLDVHFTSVSDHDTFEQPFIPSSFQRYDVDSKCVTLVIAMLEHNLNFYISNCEIRRNL